MARRIFVIDIGRLIDFWYFIADTTQKSERQINLRNNTDLNQTSVKGVNVQTVIRVWKVDVDDTAPLCKLQGRLL